MLATVNQWVHDPHTIQSAKEVGLTIGVIFAFLFVAYIAKAADEGMRWAKIVLWTFASIVVGFVSFCILTVLFILTVHVLGI